MEVGPLHVAGGAHSADGLALLNQLPLAHRPGGHVGVEGGGAVPVVDDHEVAVRPVDPGAVLRHDHLAAPGRIDGCAGGGRHVDAGVAVGHVIHRVHPEPEGGGQLPIRRRQGPHPAIAGGGQLHVVLLPLLLQLLLLAVDLRPDGGPRRVLLVQLAVDLRHVGVELVQQRLGLGHLSVPKFFSLLFMENQSET